jgi:hypothetical protein
VYSIPATDEGVLDLLSRVFVGILADRDVGIASDCSLLSQWLSEPPVEYPGRHVPPAAMMRDLNDGRRLYDTEAMSIARGLLQSSRANICCQQDRFSIDLAKLHHTCFIGRRSWWRVVAQGLNSSYFPDLLRRSSRNLAYRREYSSFFPVRLRGLIKIMD